MGQVGLDPLFFLVTEITIWKSFYFYSNHPRLWGTRQGIIEKFTEATQSQN